MTFCIVKMDDIVKNAKRKLIQNENFKATMYTNIIGSPIHAQVREVQQILSHHVQNWRI